MSASVVSFDVDEVCSVGAAPSRHGYMPRLVVELKMDVTQLHAAAKEILCELDEDILLRFLLEEFGDMVQEKSK